MLNLLFFEELSCNLPFEINLMIKNTCVPLFCFLLAGSGLMAENRPVSAGIQPSDCANKDQANMINRQYGMFIHFGINTYSGKEWTDGTLDPSIYQPGKLDTDQWAKAAKDAGMRYVILITKHHEGFCLWDSQFTNYDVGSSPVKTDVVKAMALSCQKYGMKLGLYYSLWDRNWQGGVMRGNRADLNRTQSRQYVDYMKNQLTELLTNYGDVCELWFDGGWVLPREDWKIQEVYQHVKALQPECLVGVNWTIGQFGKPDYHSIKPKDYRQGQPIRYFPSDFRLGDPMLPEFPDVKLFAGPDKKLYYLPFETTVCLNSHWFWHPYDKGLRTVAELLPLFERCTSQDNVLILNSPPNRDGLMDTHNIERLKELAAALGAVPGQSVPLNVAEKARLTSTSIWEGKELLWGAGNASDGNPATRWASAARKASITLQWDSSQKVDFIRLREYGENGQFRIQAFDVEAMINGEWRMLHRGETIGVNKVIRFEPMECQQLRLNITKSSDAPSLWHISAGHQ